MDDYSRMIWVYLLKLKSDVIVVLSNFIQLVLTQFHKSIKAVRTDNGTEFVNSSCLYLFQSHGIVHQRTCVYTPQQNGVAERIYKYTLEVARAIRFQGFIPLKF